MLSKRDTYLYYLILNKKILPQNQLNQAVQVFQRAINNGLKVNLGVVLRNQKHLQTEVIQRLYQMVDKLSPPVQKDDPAQQGTLLEETGKNKSPEVLETRTIVPGAQEKMDTGKWTRAQEALQLGQQLGDYQLLQELGRGGMGVVFRALHLSLRREVALKVMSQGLSLNKDAVERFWREVRAVAKLKHPNIVQVYSAHNEGGFYFYAMECIQGNGLDQILDKGRLPMDEALSMMIQACQAVEYAHSKAIVHRDIKPSNMLVTPEGILLLTDFGLVRDMEEQDEKLTVSGAILGTPAYMAPEQALGENDQIDETTDIYSLGATFYEILGGRPPFGGDTSQHVLFQIITEDPSSLRSIDPLIPKDLETIVLKAMRREKAKRYPHVRDLMADLERFRSGESIVARPRTLREKAWRKAKRHKTLVTLVASLLVLCLVGFFYQRAYSSKERQTEIEKRGREKAEKGEKKQRALKVFIATKKKLFTKISDGFLLVKKNPQEVNLLKNCLKELNDLGDHFPQYAHLGAREISNYRFKLYFHLMSGFGNWAIELEKEARTSRKESQFDRSKKLLTLAQKKWKKALQWSFKTKQLLHQLKKQFQKTKGEFANLEIEILARMAYSQEKQGLFFQSLKSWGELTRKQPRYKKGQLEKQKIQAILLMEKKKYIQATRLLHSILQKYGQQLKEREYQPVRATLYFLYARALLYRAKILSPSGKINLRMTKYKSARVAYWCLCLAIRIDQQMAEAIFLRGLVGFHYPAYNYPVGKRELFFPLRQALDDFSISAIYLIKKEDRQRARYYASRSFDSLRSFWKRHLMDGEKALWDQREVNTLNPSYLKKEMCFAFSKDREKKLQSFFSNHFQIDEARKLLGSLGKDISRLKEINLQGKKSLLTKKENRLLKQAYGELEESRENPFSEKFLSEGHNKAGLLLYKGQLYLQRKQWSKARTIFQKELKIQSGDPRGWKGLVDLALARKDFPGAEKLIASLSKDTREAFPLIYTVAKIREKQGQPERAKELYLQALVLEEKFPQKWDSYYVEGLRALQRARNLRITRKNVDDPPYRNWVVYLCQGAEFFSRSLDQSPSLALGRFYRGLIYFYLGRWNIAREDLWQALKINPYLLSAYPFLALMEGLMVQKYQKGLSIFHRGEALLKSLIPLAKKNSALRSKIISQIQVFFFYYTFYIENGFSLLSQNKQKAMASVHQLEKRMMAQRLVPFSDLEETRLFLQNLQNRWHNPDFSGAPKDFPLFAHHLFFTYMGQSLQRVARVGDELVASYIAKVQAPSVPYVYFYLGDGYFRSKPFPLVVQFAKEIILNFARAVELEPRYGNPLYEQIQKLNKIRPFAKVFAGSLLKTLAQLKKDYPSNPSADFLYGFYYYLEGNTAKVNKHIQRAVAIKPSLKVFGHALLGRLYYEKGDYVKGEVHLKISLGAFRQYYPGQKTYSLSALWLAELYTKQGKYPQAFELLKQAIRGGFPKQAILNNPILKPFHQRLADF